jgi:beta-galactosidase
VRWDPTSEPAGRVRVENIQHFRDLGWLRGRWRLADDGSTLAEGAMALPPLGPGAEGWAELVGWQDHDPSGAERWLTFWFEVNQSQAWAEEGHIVGWEQVQISDTDGLPGLAIDPAGHVDLDGEGLLRHPLMATSPRLSVWRAPTENDRFGGMSASWREVGLDDPRRLLTQVHREGPVVTVESEVHVGSHVIGHRQVITALLGGDLHIAETASVPDGLHDLPRVGTVLELVPGFEDVEWFGRGPHESYPDRKRSAMVDRWQSTVSEMFTPYIRPQESGGRADVRWLSVSAGDGRHVRITMDEPRQVAATHHRDADLDGATHHDELVAASETIVHLDAVHRGLGTASCGPDTLPSYIHGPGEYRWAWTLSAARSNDSHGSR